MRSFLVGSTPPWGFEKKGDGLMTPTDKEHGWSYESRYEILGMVAWPTLQAVKLPKWALPTWENGFSLDALPKSRRRGPRVSGPPSPGRT
jgi:hypothetical protein